MFLRVSKQKFNKAFSNGYEELLLPESSLGMLAEHTTSLYL